MMANEPIGATSTLTLRFLELDDQDAKGKQYVHLTLRFDHQDGEATISFDVREDNGEGGFESTDDPLEAVLEPSHLGALHRFIGGLRAGLP